MSDNRSILVIEDELSVKQAVVRICTEYKHAVEAVESAQAGLKALAENSYKLVICDIMLPGMDGFRFLEEMSKRGDATPVVIMTGYSTMENAARSLSLGAVDYIPKPFTADELLTVIQRSLRSGLLLQEAEAARLGRDRPLNFVPTPSTYHCLGYVSWVLMEKEGTAKIGVNDLFLKAVGGIETIEMSAQGDELVQSVPCAIITAPDGSKHDIMCPMGGKILEVNQEVLSKPSLAEKDPYFRGWLYQLLPSNPDNNLKWLSS